MLEHRTKPLLSQKAFAARLLRWLGVTLFLLALSLFVGMWGYHRAIALEKITH
jgi:hypothetical protein